LLSAFVDLKETTGIGDEGRDKRPSSKKGVWKLIGPKDSQYNADGNLKHGQNG
jgi:hypothetical protein